MIRKKRWLTWKWQTLTDMGKARECTEGQPEGKWAFPIGSQVYRMLGFHVHETILGERNGKIVFCHLYISKTTINKV